MQENRISEMIDKLPPLPETIIKLEKFKETQDKEPIELLRIIEKDPLIISMLLKVSNSAIFGFRSGVETPSRALSLLGVNYTLSIAFGHTIKNTLNTNLKAYGISSNEFINLASISSNLLSLWLSKVDYELKERLLLPVFLQEAGIFILANIANNENSVENFYKEIKLNKNIAKVENNFFNTSTSYVSAAIFKHWKLNKYLINSVEFVDDLDNCPNEFKYEAQILHIVKIACNILDPLSDENVARALKKAKEFGLDIKPLNTAITKLQDRMLEK